MTKTIVKGRLFTICKDDGIISGRICNNLHVKQASNTARLEIYKNNKAIILLEAPLLHIRVYLDDIYAFKFKFSKAKGI